MLKMLFKSIDSMIRAMIIASFSVLCIAIFMQVVTRYIFSFSLPWTEEAGRFLFLALSYSGIVLGMKGRAHLRVDIVILYLPDGLKKIFEALSQIICMAFFLFVTCEGIAMTLKVCRLEQFAVSFPLPIWLVWACIPFCSFLTALQCIKNIYEIISEKQLGCREETA